MPVPVWDCTDMGLLEEPLDSVLSDDIWKKFDLDEPLDSQYIYGQPGLGSTEKSSLLGGCNSYEESNLPSQSVTLSEFYDKVSCRESREIRHHDCMWAGLCISKEHNRTLPAKKDTLQNNKKVPAGRSLLISSRSPQQIQLPQQQKSTFGKQRRNRDGLESDGDSARPETPQSSESESEDEREQEDDDEDDDDEDEEDKCQSRLVDEENSRRPNIHNRSKFQEDVSAPLIFKHDQISINEKLSECMSDEINGLVKSAPVSEVTGQFVRKSNHYHPHHHHHLHHNGNNHQTNHQTRIKIEDEESERYSSHNSDNQQRFVKNEPDNWNTLNDHCYHQPSSKKLDHLGVQTPSDSEEEIDVVTFEKPCRPAALPTYPSIADQQRFQLTVKSALKEKPVVAPRPRGRPPSSGTPRKRSAPSDPKAATKRPRHRNYQNRTKVTKNGTLTPASSPLKNNNNNNNNSSNNNNNHNNNLPIGQSSQMTNSRSSSSDDEPDTEKRSLHNNMERQRRIELRNAFEDLRLLVPEIEDKEKAPKVAILRQAAIYCDTLTEIDRATTARVIEMKKRQERLRARLSQLRRSLAMTR